MKIIDNTEIGQFKRYIRIQMEIIKWLLLVIATLCWIIYFQYDPPIGQYNNFINGCESMFCILSTYFLLWIGVNYVKQKFI